jgi:hypothetical protein
MPLFYAAADDIRATPDVERMSHEAAHTSRMRVLVVEDHATGRIAQGLRQAGLAVDAVYDGAAAVEAARRRRMT